MMASSRYAFLLCALTSCLLTVLSFQGLSGASLEAAPGENAGGDILLKVEGLEVQEGFSIEVFADPNTKNWVLSIGPDQITFVVQIKTNGEWILMVRDNDPRTAGFMTDFDGSHYNTSQKLTNPLKVSGAYGEVTLPEGGVIYAGNSTEMKKVGHVVTLTQDTLWTDELSKGNQYMIVLTFTATAPY
jgi:hypothetical protein